MQRCSAVLTSGAGAIKRKSVERGDQDHSLPEKVTKLDLAKKFWVEQEYQFDCVFFSCLYFFLIFFFIIMHLTSRLLSADSAVTFDLILPSSSWFF